MKCWFCAVILLLGLGMGLQAQDAFLGLTYSIGLPLDHTKDFLNKTSYLGFNFEARKFIRESFTFGLSLNWQAFAHDVVRQGEVVQKRNIDAFPLLATTHYYFRGSETFIPYAGFGAGAYRITLSVKEPEEDFQEANWHLGLAPELGLIIRLDYGVGLLCLVKYNYAFAAGKADSQTWLSLQFGAAWTGD